MENIDPVIKKTKIVKKLKLKKNIPDLNEDNIEEIFIKNFDNTEFLIDDVDYNTFLDKKEILNRDIISNIYITIQRYVISHK